VLAAWPAIVVNEWQTPVVMVSNRLMNKSWTAIVVHEWQTPVVMVNKSWSERNNMQTLQVAETWAKLCNMATIQFYHRCHLTAAENNNQYENLPATTNKD